MSNLDDFIPPNSDGGSKGDNVNGFWKIYSDGTIDQWGNVVVSGDTTITHPLPISFIDGHGTGLVAYNHTNPSLSSPPVITATELFEVEITNGYSGALGIWWFMRGS